MLWLSNRRWKIPWTWSVGAKYARPWATEMGSSFSTRFGPIGHVRILTSRRRDSAAVVAAWPHLPEHVRAAILTMVEAARVPSDDSE